MNCSEALAQLLSGEVTEEAASHIDECAGCATNRSELDILHQVLAEEATWVQPSDDLKKRILSTSVPSETPMRTGFRLAVIAAGIAAAVAIFTLARPAPNWEIEMYASDNSAVATLAGWNEDTGTRLLFDGSLVEPGEGFVYELWFSDESRILSAGTFVSGEDVAMSIAVRRGELPNLWVSLEPIDGDPSPSGEVVLTSSK